MQDYSTIFLNRFKIRSSFKVYANYSKLLKKLRLRKIILFKEFLDSLDFFIKIYPIREFTKGVKIMLKISRRNSLKKSFFIRISVTQNFIYRFELDLYWDIVFP
jgi:hypothetical protein